VLFRYRTASTHCGGFYDITIFANLTIAYVYATFYQSVLWIAANIGLPAGEGHLIHENKMEQQ